MKAAALKVNIWDIQMQWITWAKWYKSIDGSLFMIGNLALSGNPLSNVISEYGHFSLQNMLIVCPDD